MFCYIFCAKSITEFDFVSGGKIREFHYRFPVGTLQYGTVPESLSSYLPRQGSHRLGKSRINLNKTPGVGKAGNLQKNEKIREF